LNEYVITGCYYKEVWHYRTNYFKWET